MSKIMRRMRRIRNMCKNKQYTVNKSLTVEEREEIDTWCHENLNGSFIWVIDQPHNSTYTLGFQDYTDMMAFVLRWE